MLAQRPPEFRSKLLRYAAQLRRPELGTIAPGQLADLAGWDRDILEDHEALSHCAFVMKDGQVIDQNI